MDKIPLYQFHFFACLIRTAMSMNRQVSLWWFRKLWVYASEGIAVSYDTSASSPEESEHWLPKWLHLFIVCQQWINILLSQCPGCQLLALVFLILAILNRVRWNLSVVLFFISLIAGDDERFLKCLLVIFILLRTVFSSRVHFLNFTVYFLCI